MTRRFPGSFWPLTALMVLALAVTACDSPEPTAPLARGGGFELAASHTPTNGTVNCALGASQTKTVPITVRNSQNQLVTGAVVTAVDPNVEGGARCWGTTLNGVLQMTLPRDAMRFFTVRTEVSADAPHLEIVPPAPITNLMLAHDPAANVVRNGARLIGGRQCNVATEFGWDYLVGAAQDPCRIQQLNSLSVTLPAKTGSLLYPEFKDLNGNALPGVIVAALSGAAFQGPDGTFDESKVDYYCELLPFLNRHECQQGQSHGPAFVYAMTKTGADGKPPAGLAVGPGKILIEAIAPLAGGGLFATIEGYPSSTSLKMEPGICKVSTLDDALQSADAAAIDILSANYGVGLEFKEETSSTGLITAKLNGIPTTLVLKTLVHVKAASTGRVTYTYRTSMGGNNTVRADFSVTPGAPQLCNATWSGNGYAGAATGKIFCAETNPNANDGRYTLIFQLYNLPVMTEASFSLSTDPAGGMSGDNLDPSRSDLSAASIPFDLDASVCPIQLNTDGKLIGIT